MLSNIKHLNSLKYLNINKDKVLIFGSGLLSLLELRENNDLDLLAIDEEFSRISRDKRFECKALESGEIYYQNGETEVYNTLKPDIGFTKEELFEKAIKVNEFLFIPLGLYIKWKTQMSRPKDKKDIELLQKKYKGIIQFGTGCKNF